MSNQTLATPVRAHAKQLLKVRTIYVFLAKLYPKQLSPEKSDKSALSRKFSQTLEKWFALRVYFIRSKFQKDTNRIKSFRANLEVNKNCPIFIRSDNQDEIGGKSNCYKKVLKFQHKIGQLVLVYHLSTTKTKSSLKTRSRVLQVLE